jgi:GT2 family glycosyltransferase
MQKRMNIFVVIVTYNGSQWLNRCLSSLFNSSIPVQVIVVDNNSTDDSLKIVGQFPEVKTFISKENLGFGRANNSGIQYALEQGADYVFLLNQDAWVKHNTIEDLVDASLSHPEYYVLSPMHLEGTETKLDLYFQHYISPQNCSNLLSDLAVMPRKLKEVYETRFVNAALWLMPRKCLIEVGGFDPIFAHYGEDNDLVKRIKYHGYKTGICPALFGVHDRPQRKDLLGNGKGKPKPQSRMETEALIKLMDINSGLAGIALRLYVKMFKGILLSAFQMQFAESGKQMAVLVNTTGKLRNVIKHRAISEKRGASATWLRNSPAVDPVQLVDYSIPGEF